MHGASGRYSLLAKQMAFICYKLATQMVLHLGMFTLCQYFTPNLFCNLALVEESFITRIDFYETLL